MLSRARGKTRFTLVELLVVIAIISVLAGMLLPALSKAMESARSTQCTAQLRQVGFGVNAYLEDNREYFFPAYAYFGASAWTWYSDYYFAGGALYGSGNDGYLGIRWKPGDYWKNTILDCPTNPSGYAGLAIDYAYNGSLFINVPGNLWGNRKRIRIPSRTVVFADARGKGQGATPGGYYYFQKWSPEPWDERLNYELHRNRNAANHLFVDQHAAGADLARAMSEFVYTPDDE